MNSIYEYSDYRRYLRDYFTAKKRESKGFSLKVLADRAGFKARDYLLRVMNGTRNLSRSSAFMLSNALRLSEKEADYFANMIAFNQAETVREKEFFFKKMSEVCAHGKHQRLRQDQFDYFSEWYFAALRSLLPVMSFKDNFSELAKFLDPPLTATQARKAVELLLQLGLLAKDASGNYTVLAPQLTGGDEVTSVALARFHRQSLDLARRAIDYYPARERDVSGVTMSLSSAGFDKIKAEIQAFRKRAMRIAEQDANEEGVFQLNLQFFPLSKRKKR
jgi:uncharacterized protein (TIGR02147 family)